MEVIRRCLTQNRLPQGLTGESFVAELGIAIFHGDPERAGQRLLKDYRTGALGLIALEQPPLMPCTKLELDVSEDAVGAEHLQ